MCNMFINTRVSNKAGKKMAEIPQKHDFLTWGIQTFVRKVKQFVRKYYITWLHLFFNKQSIFDPRPENCLSFSKKSPQKIV